MPSRNNGLIARLLTIPTNTVDLFQCLTLIMRKTSSFMWSEPGMEMDTSKITQYINSPGFKKPGIWSLLSIVTMRQEIKLRVSDVRVFRNLSYGLDHYFLRADIIFTGGKNNSKIKAETNRHGQNWWKKIQFLMWDQEIAEEKIQPELFKLKQGRR